MDHPAAAPDSLVRPWRTATIVLTAVAAVQLVLLILAGVVLLGRSLSDNLTTAAKKKAHKTAAPAAVQSAPRKPRPAPVPKPKLSRAETSVLVLNGNGRSGAAGAEAARVRARGYRISSVRNARRNDYARSVVMYRPGYRGEAARLARDLRIRMVSPLDGLKPAALHGAHLALVVGG